MVGRVCYFYGLTPAGVLAIPFRHFTVMYGAIENCLRQQAQMAACAYHSPGSLFEQKAVKVTDPATLLAAVNG